MERISRSRTLVKASWGVLRAAKAPLSFRGVSAVSSAFHVK